MVRGTTAIPATPPTPSLTDLPWRSRSSSALVKALVPMYAAFAEDSVRPRGAVGAGGYLDQHPGPGRPHTSHIHPHSVISGTTYVQVPPGARSIQGGDPRHAM